jgi:hypothetical protein
MPLEIKRFSDDRAEIGNVTDEAREAVSGHEEITEVRAHLRNLGTRETLPLNKLIYRAKKQSRENGIGQGVASSLTPTLDILRATLVGEGGKGRLWWLSQRH